jgi:hypothetical protein
MWRPEISHTVGSKLRGRPRQSSPSAGAAGKLQGTGAACFSHGGTAPAVASRGAAAFGASLGEPADPLAPCPAARLARRRFQECPRQRPARCRDAAAGLARPRCDVDAADLDHLLQPASKPSPSTGESEELNIVSSRQGRARRGSRVKKDCAIFSSCCTPYCVKKTVWHKILTEIT